MLNILVHRTTKSFLLQSTTVVDIVQESVTTSNGQQFYGIYSQSLPSRCWLPDNKTLVLNTIQRASLKPYLVDIGIVFLFHSF